MTGVCVSALIAGTAPHNLEAGFGERIAENQRRVFQIAYSILRNSADAEDVAQEAFLRAYQKRASLREAEKFRGWVNRVVFPAGVEPAEKSPATADTRYGVADERDANDGRWSEGCGTVGDAGPAPERNRALAAETAKRPTAFAG